MNSTEFMSGTNRFVVKLDDNSKVIITRELVNDKTNYLVKVTNDINYALTKFALECGYIIMLHGMNIEDDSVIIEGTVIENIILKEEYHIVNGNQFGKFIVSHIPFPEEPTRIVPITLCFENIKEMTGDLDMIQDMVDDKLLTVSTEDLIKHGIIIKTQLKVVTGSKNSEKENLLDKYPALLTVMNGRSKVKKK